MTDEQLAQALSISNPAVGQRAGIDDPSENRELWDYGGGGPRVALANDGRMLVVTAGQTAALTPQALIALIAYGRQQLGV